MNIEKIMFYLLAVMLGGCVPIVSLYPLYNENDAILEEKLLGQWIQDSNETSWQFVRPDPNSADYRLILSDEEQHKGLFTCRFTKISDKLFLNVFPAESPWGTEDNNSLPWHYNVFFMIPAHTCIRVDSIEPKLVLCLLYEDKVNKILEQKPESISHLIINERLVLNAPTEQLRSFISEHAADEDLFKEKIILIKKSEDIIISIPKEPNFAEPNNNPHQE